MIPSRPILFNAGLLTALFAMQSLTYSLGFSRLLVFYVGIAAALLLVNKQELARHSRMSFGIHRVIVGFAAAFVLMHIARESVDYAALVGDTRMGIKLGLVELATAGTLFVFGMAFRRSGGMLQFLATVTLAISGYVALNLVLETTGWMQGAIEEGFQSRYAEGLLRWMPPLTKSNGLFSILNRYALSLGVLFLVCYRKNLPRAVMLAITVSLVTGAYAGVLLEHRATVIPVLVAPLAYWLARSKFAAAVPAAMLSAVVVVPIVVGAGWWEPHAEKLIPRFVMDLMGDPATVYTLSGRDSIYEYGVTYATGPRLRFFGDGPVLRDSLPGFREDSRLAIEAAVAIGTARQTFGFHSGFLDIMIPYGVPCGLLFFLFVGASIAVLHRRSAAQSDGATLGLTNLAILLSVNVLDGGFSDFNILFLTLIGTATAVAQATDFSLPHRITHAAVRRPLVLARQPLAKTRGTTPGRELEKGGFGW